MSNKYDQDDTDVSLTAEAQYMHQVHWTPKLTLEEETSLFQRLERGKHERAQLWPDQRVLADAKQARDRLVEGFQGFVTSLASQWVWRFRNMDLMDVIQEGNEGLMQAIELHDPTKGYPLRALAGTCIRHAIIDALAKRDGQVRLNNRMRKEVTAFGRVERDLFQTLQREPMVAEVAAALQVSSSKVFDLLALRQWREVGSIEAMLQDEEDHEEGEEFACESVFAAAATPPPLGASVCEAVEQVLSEPERQVIQLRYGLAEEGDETLSLARVAVLLGVSVTTVAVRERRAHQCLHWALAPSLGLERGEPPVVAPQVICVVCGEMVPPKVGGGLPRVYCSERCRRKAYRLRQREVA